MSARDGLWQPVEPVWLQEADADVTLFLKSLREPEDDMTGTNVATIPSNAVSMPIEWDRELRGAGYLVKSGLCPTAVRTPEAALFIILAGRDLGLSPVAALRNIHIIQGKVELSADMQLALFASRGGRFRWLVVSETEATIELHAPWLMAPHVSRWTMADAQRANLAGSDNWKKYPRAMLRSRAITAGLKDIGFDATAGVYAPGEADEAETTILEADEVVSVVTATESQETGEAPSAEQMALLEKMMKSSVWTETDRTTYQMLAAKYTKRQMSNLLDEIIEIGKQKKAERKAAESGAAADDNAEALQLGALAGR